MEVTERKRKPETQLIYWDFHREAKGKVTDKYLLVDMAKAAELDTMGEMERAVAMLDRYV